MLYVTIDHPFLQAYDGCPFQPYPSSATSAPSLTGSSLPTSLTFVVYQQTMSQRIHLNPNAPRAPMMGPGSGYTPEAVRPAGGARPSYNAGGGLGAGGDGDDVLSQVKRLSSKVEDAIEAYSHVSL